MLKVGILSMQRIANYGSFLQAYGLKKMLEELGCEVQFVDYHPGETLIPTEEGKGIKRKIQKVLEVFGYKASLFQKVKFILYKKNYAKKYYPYLGIDENRNYSPELDILLIGSDEVFNCVQDNTNVGFSLELFGANNKAKRLISYAASFGNTTIEKLRTYEVEQKIAECLKDFDAISVRDKNSGEIVKILTGQNPKYNLDPVLVYNFVKNCEEIPKAVKEKKYMILYGYSGRFTEEECNYIRKYAQKKGLKIFCIGGIQSCCDKFIDCDPFSVIAYFQHADYVVTDTFHGSILSIITHKQFVTIVRRSIGNSYGNEEKLLDLLNCLELSARMTTKISLIEKINMQLIDYSKVDSIISKERESTEAYLRRNIGILNGKYIEV